MEEYLNDPLYRAVLTAKTLREMDKATKTARAIRGDSAWTLFINKLKEDGKKKLPKIY
jgi:hypothetical protein